MAITATTLSAAIGSTDASLVVASATGITAPNNQTGSGVTFLYVDSELMGVTAINSTYVSVARGLAGTQQVAHVSGATVLAGANTDFPNFTPTLAGSFAVAQNNYSPVGATIASAATIAAPSARFHVSGGTAINIITPPAGMVEGAVVVIFDSACTWTSSNVTNGIKASGTCTTAGSAVEFYLDAATARWYPGRLA